MDNVKGASDCSRILFDKREGILNPVPLKVSLKLPKDIAETFSDVIGSCFRDLVTFIADKRISDFANILSFETTTFADEKLIVAATIPKSFDGDIRATFWALCVECSNFELRRHTISSCVKRGENSAGELATPPRTSSLQRAASCVESHARRGV